MKNIKEMKCTGQEQDARHREHQGQLEVTIIHESLLPKVWLEDNTANEQTKFNWYLHTYAYELAKKIKNQETRDPVRPNSRYNVTWPKRNTAREQVQI